ncbi:DNA-binding transcriptional LysR family regulator [Pseudomonas duriflava]|uniref:DNA-binding transcriptional LysR family regulator n=1 Tax=Pseudomonas duriflava TaxID=459528 RepID=A0A562QND6_9PSED|nr:LysR substrate-binding domain-containing protein [Pseudomonas duriflava]TWI57576.1 DNA-binding transcriptional LysR family regulator [Pseudomonas duriflava]
MLRELKTFMAVARHGTFSAAGQHVGLTQSAVSAQMRHLEQDLGVRLFDRTGRAALLNAAGQQALPLAEQILALYEQMAAPADVAHWQGELKVGAIASVQTGVLPEALMRFRREAPQVDIKLIPGVSLHLLGQVDAGEIDLALMIKPPFNLPKELTEVALNREPFVLITPFDLTGDDPLTLLEAQPFVRYDRRSFGGRQVSHFLQAQRLTVKEALELDELEAIVRMVECGLGVALIPQAGLLLERQAHVRILSLGALTFYRELVGVMRRGLRKQAALATFLECIHQAQR